MAKGPRQITQDESRSVAEEFVSESQRLPAKCRAKIGAARRVGMRGHKFGEERIEEVPQSRQLFRRKTKTKKLEQIAFLRTDRALWKNPFPVGVENTAHFRGGVGRLSAS